MSTPSSIEVYRQELIQKISAPYLEEIRGLKDKIAKLEQALEQMKAELEKKDNYISELEDKVEKLSMGKRLTKPLTTQKEELDDVISFILSR